MSAPILTRTTFTGPTSGLRSRWNPADPLEVHPLDIQKIMWAIGRGEPPPGLEDEPQGAIATAALYIGSNGFAAIDEVLVGTLRELKPDGANRFIGSAGNPWGDVYAVRLHGAGTDITGVEKTANKGIANGYASLGSDSLVPSAQLRSVATVATTDATPTTAATLALSDDTAYLLTVEIVGRRTDAAGRCCYVRRALVYREAAGAATIQGMIDTPFTRESTAGYGATLTASGNNILVQVTGAAAHAINWQVTYRMDRLAA